jgi:D-3-phosphoglycerate dehydrogenase
MSAPLVAVADTVFPSLEPARQALAELNAELQLAAEPTPEAILAVARQADAVMVTYAKITGEIIRQLERCQIIARFGIGIDNIDIDTASEAGIVVTYVPDYCIDEVSDQAMALLLALARKVTYANQLVQAGRWEMPAVVPLHRLRGHTLGLVGFGKIPQLVAPKAQAFGLNVITFDPYISNDITSALGVERVDFDQLLETSDYISIHAPLTPETHHLFNAQAFKLMKPEALLINTARGPLIDGEALAHALDEGRLGGAALDVMPVEPPPADSPLLGRDNVILTPHTAFYSEESLLDLQTKAARDVAQVLSGRTPAYPVNPQVLKSNQ